jgi:hypothetical protein
MVVWWFGFVAGLLVVHHHAGTFRVGLAHLEGTGGVEKGEELAKAYLRYAATAAATATATAVLLLLLVRRASALSHETRRRQGIAGPVCVAPDPG